MMVYRKAFGLKAHWPTPVPGLADNVGAKCGARIKKVYYCHAGDVRTTDRCRNPMCAAMWDRFDGEG